MPRCRCLLPLVFLVFWAGCFPVASLVPFHDPENVVYEPRLVGAWGDSACGTPEWTFSHLGDSTYRVTVVEDSARDGSMLGRLVRVRNALLLDLYPDLDSVLVKDRSGLVSAYLAPLHVIIRLDLTGPNLTISHLDDSWLEEHLERSPNAIRHATIDETVILTAPAHDIRAFIGRHLEDEGAFEKFGNYVRCAESGAGSG